MPRFLKYILKITWALLILDRIKIHLKLTKLIDMKKLLTLVIFLTSISFLWMGCDVAQPAMSSEPLRYHSADNGFLIGSITFPKEKANFNGYFIRVTSLDADPKIAKANSKEIQISPEQIWKLKHKGQLDEGRTYLFALERPTGKYEISSIRLFTNSALPVLQQTNYTGSFSIPFEVEKRKPTYVGNIVFNEYASKTDTLVAYRNHYKRDIEAIKKLQPTIDWDKASNDESRKIEYTNKRVKL